MISHPRGPPPRPPPLTRPKKVSVACAECRKRKTKCVGGVPCAICRRHNVDCVLDEDTDRRRKGTLERRLEALEQDQSLLRHLLGTIHDDDPTRFDRILEFIRTDASLDQVRLFITNTCSQPADGEQIRLFDHPVYLVPAQPWTSLTEDDDYVSRLISLYFTWNHPTQIWIDRDLFIQDMQSGDPNALFCSPLLVNALLAVACCYLDVPDPVAVAGAPPGRLRFFSEAKGLLGKEEGKLSLPSYQACCALYLSASVLGKCMLAWQYLVDIARYARELMEKHNMLVARAGERVSEMARGLDTAILGSFSLLPVAVPSFHQPSKMKKPACGFPPQEHDLEDTWHSYPIKGSSTPAHANCLAEASFGLQLIVWDISNNSFGRGQGHETSGHDYYDRLKQWASQLPECVKFKDTKTPATLDLQMRYYSAVISAFEFSEDTNAPDVRIFSAHTICSLLGEFMARWPATYTPVNYIRYISVVLSTLLPHLGKEENKSLFISCFFTLHSMEKRLPMAAKVLQHIRDKARQLHIGLPRQVISLG
ncbi:hypothetical protein BO70DRAFT_423052 [Aspergillus heteromorphus CBS 117.55]|uniref:Zn(2)-C6 fungal-type domain-containing protein n=1 Tax=Aspergillus heteromorphus CBS 117.55 TaxID=1448321 RepID=A0A317WLK7_9EURO|nr:uncharacterized protein BO70DRAFT_423052 [Aspergillus heteromorphus CBS 117.55]PWY85937.1 hypothetical protein BO70DRAFT_423052 [Aspergillus heteromorphus CBS 117.55]